MGKRKDTSDKVRTESIRRPDEKHERQKEYTRSICDEAYAKFCRGKASEGLYE